MFHLDQQVVCVDDSNEQAITFCRPLFRGILLPVELKKGQIYTVTTVGITHPHDILQLPCICVDGGNDPYWASRFRPLTKTETENEVSNEAESV